MGRPKYWATYKPYPMYIRVWAMHLKNVATRSQISAFFFFIKIKANYRFCEEGFFFNGNRSHFPMSSFMRTYIGIRRQWGATEVRKNANFFQIFYHCYRRTCPGIVLLESWSNVFTGQNGLCGFLNPESHFEWVTWHYMNTIGVKAD